MDNAVSNKTAAIREAFDAYEAQERISNTKVGCALVVFLMPAGSLLDYFVYEPRLWSFLQLRLICSALAAIIWAFLFTGLGQRSGRWLGVIVPLLPVVFIAWMIRVEGGFASPYYAGLNLVLLAVGAVLHWSLLESVIAVALVFGIYIGAGLLHGTFPARGIMVNNFYFMTLMDIIVVVGTYVQYRARYREFELRFELDHNRQQLQESNTKLMELDQLKSRFFANVSHELRTPLTLLLAPLETMLRRFDRSSDPETRDMLVTMQGNGMRLLKLINDLLDLVRLESGRMEVKQEPVPMVEAIKGLASAAQQVAEDKRLIFKTDVDPELGSVLGDRDKLEKIVLNLVFNALKFTPRGGTVELRAERQLPYYALIVADTGMGISEKNLPFVFDRFWQADDSSKRKYQGVGIGLALVKELVEIQGGKVEVQSEEGRGTTFTVLLPYKACEGVQAAEPTQTAGPSANGGVASEEWLANLYRRAELFPALTSVQQALKTPETAASSQLPKILIADDEPDMLRFLASQLGAQYQVLEAVDGQQAIEKACQFLPDIILLDMMMPEKDGLQACRELRDRTPTKKIPIVLLTARADEETKLHALSAGASDFLTKPFSTTELHVRLKNLVESYDYQSKLTKQNQVLEHTIDQLKETESQLVQSEKMASLGRLSAGMIHEINNPLNFATTGLFSLRGKEQFLAEEQRPEFVEILNDVDEGIRRVRDLVVSMRIFSYDEKAPASPESITLNEIIEPALRFLSHEWRDKVAVHQALPADVAIWANKNKLIQVTVNLLQNSLDAFARKPFKDEQPAIWIEGETKENKGILTVRDNGEGIDPRNMDKIFDPFFTTKEIGEGMGLGLSICYRIVQRSNGRIHVRSELGKFTEFRLEFPASGTGTLAA